MTPAKREALDGIVRRARVIPVVTIEDLTAAVPLARTLAQAGLPVIEVTLRTPKALAAIEAIARDVPEALIIAGTITTPSQIGEALEAGAKALVSPGTTERLAEALAAAPAPALPGCATAGEAMRLHEHGFELLKFFPAAASGGTAWLKSIAGPLPHLRFCPTGGLDAANAGSYLALPNVACVGGAWMAPAKAIAAGDWETVARLARDAAALAP